MEDLVSQEMSRLAEKIRSSAITLQEKMELEAKARMPVLRSTLLEYFQIPTNPIRSLPVLETIGGRRYDELAIIDAVCIMRFMAGETKEKPEYFINSLVKAFIDVQQEELEAFFDEKFVEYSMMGGRDRMVFAAREYEKLAVDSLSRHYPEIDEPGFGNMTFRNAMRSFPVVLQWIDFLKAIGEGRIEVAGESPTLEAETRITAAPPRKSIVFQNDETIMAIYKGLKAFFPEREDDLLILLKGGNVDMKLHFPDQQNRLAEVFSRAYYNGKMGGTKTDVQAWIVANFTYLNRLSNKPTSFKPDTLRSIFNPSAKGEAKKGKRITIEGLAYIAPENREGYAVK